MKSLGRSLAGAAVLLSVGQSPAIAQQTLETVASPVVEATGDRAALTRRAATCLAQNAGVTGQAIAQTDVEGGTVVGPTLFSYSQGGIPWSVRSTLTIEAKDGRFRMTHTGLSHKQGGPATSRSSFAGLFSSSVDQRSEGGWMPVGKWRFSGGEKAEAAAQALSTKIADCVKAAPAADSW